MEGPFVNEGYSFVMNQDAGRRQAFVDTMDAQYAKLDDFLNWQSPGGTFLFKAFGLAETVFTPMFMRFWFLDYYERYDIPQSLKRVRRWRDACLEHPAAQQVSREEIVKVYYDYALARGTVPFPRAAAAPASCSSRTGRHARGRHVTSGARPPATARSACFDWTIPMSSGYLDLRRMK